MEYTGSDDVLLDSDLSPVCLRRYTPGRVEKAFFFLGADPRKYDSAHQVTVLLTYNDALKSCIENKILDSSLSTRDKLDKIAVEVGPIVRNLAEESRGKPGTGIHLITGEDGTMRSKKYDEIEIFSGFIDLPEIPQSLSVLPTVSITDLIRLERLAYAVDLVDLSGDKYAFKKTLNAASTITEISALHALCDCEVTNPLQALVIDDTNGSIRIRGFLSRFLPGGTLGALLERREAQRAAGGPQVSIPWRTKVAWVFSLARVLLAMQMHGVSANGDLKPDNVMLDGRGRIRLIDFAPAGPTYDWGAPEYIAAWETFRASSLRKPLGGADVDAPNGEPSTEYSPQSPVDETNNAAFQFEGMLTPAMDVYGLGAIMWALGEEKASGLEDRTWEISEDWYRDLAEACLRSDPARRPSAARFMFSLVGRSLLRFVGRN